MNMPSRLWNRIPIASHSGGSSCDPGTPMITILQRDDLMPAGIQPGQQQREFSRLGAAVRQVHAVEPLGHRRRQLGHVLVVPRMQVDSRRVAELVRLFRHRGDDLRVAMADGDGRDATEHVQIPTTLLVPEPLCTALVQQQGLLVEGFLTGCHAGFA